MPLQKKSLLAHMDAAVVWTGIPQLAMGEVHRRPLRWLPILALTLATTGIVVILYSPSKYWIGYAALMLGFGIGNFLPIKGPLKPPMDAVDERERTLRRDALLIGFGTISLVAFLGLWILMALTFFCDWPRDILLRAMMALGFYLITLYSSVPTLYASWAIPEPIDDED